MNLISNERISKLITKGLREPLFLNHLDDIVHNTFSGVIKNKSRYGISNSTLRDIIDSAISDKVRTLVDKILTEYIEDEKFIDEIISRIKRKQL